MTMQNPIEIRGIEFVEFASHDPDALHRLFLEFGFSRVMRHAERSVPPSASCRGPIDLYVQGEIHFLLNRDPRSFAASFEQAHGPCITSMGWKTALPPIDAARLATERGATPMKGDYRLDHDVLPGIRGIGDSIVYLVPASGPGTGRELWARMGFRPLENPDVVKEKGFRAIDHLTNNVFKGTMARTAAFYKEVFGFTEVRYFDIRGAKTGLTSYALRSPDGSFCIPINEGTEAKSQINEYLEEYRGPGVQHLAFLTDDILASLAALEGTKSISFLDIDDEYYADVFAKHPSVTEDHVEIRKRNVLVDGDEKGYLLQIFTKNLVGPIFIEIIQRHNHLSFGEGNFGALFRSIERDQEKRGYLA